MIMLFDTYMRFGSCTLGDSVTVFLGEPVAYYVGMGCHGNVSKHDPSKRTSVTKHFEGWYCFESALGNF